MEGAPLQKECVVNAMLMAKLVRPTEGIPPGVTSTVRHNKHTLTHHLHMRQTFYQVATPMNSHLAYASRHTWNVQLTGIRGPQWTSGSKFHTVIKKKSHRLYHRAAELVKIN